MNDISSLGDYGFDDSIAVLEALEDGTIDRNLYENYLKMEKEKNYFASTAAEKRQKDKDFGNVENERRSQAATASSGVPRVKRARII